MNVEHRKDGNGDSDLTPLATRHPPLGRDRRRRVGEGVCLRRLNYGNTSQVVSFLTPHYGRVECICKGIWRTPKKGMPAGIDLLGRYRLTWGEAHYGGLNPLFNSTMIENFAGIRSSVERALCGYYAVELMRNFTTTYQECAPLYAVLLENLKTFATGKKLGLGVLDLEINVLKHYGACPDFSECAGCGKNLRQSKKLRFCAQHGGMLCGKCCGKNNNNYPNKTSVAVTPPTVDFLRKISTSTSEKINIPPPGRIVAASKVLRFHISWLLGKELSMWKYLHRRYYSRFLGRISF